MGERTAEGRRGSDPVLIEFPDLSMMELSMEGVIVAVNDSYCALMGRPRELLLGESPLGFTHPDDEVATRAVLSALSAIPSTGMSYKKRYVRQDGRVIWVQVTFTGLAGQDRVLGHVADISELVATRDAATTTARRLGALIEHSSDLIVVLDAQGRVIHANPASQQLVELNVGQHAPSFLAERVHPEDISRALQAMADLYATPGIHPGITCRVAGPNGSWVYLSGVGNNQLDDPAISGIVITAHDVSQLEQHSQEVRRHVEALVATLARTTEFRDPYTADHQLKVAVLARRIAQQLGLAEESIRSIEVGASLHDIGKIAVPAEILARPGALTPFEFELVKTHCRVGYDILTGVDLPWQITDIVLHHHERLDGSGYPDALTDQAISIGALIVGVADVIDAMASHRPYRPSLGIEAAREELRRNRGRLYDPAVVDAALVVTAPDAAGSGPAQETSTRQSRDTSEPVAEDRALLRLTLNPGGPVTVPVLVRPRRVVGA
jgi:PAS domain S-box-containing protein/putative nucleotidyltransferase with HDIG domain